jgi:hypothetical protein
MGVGSIERKIGGGNTVSLCHRTANYIITQLHPNYHEFGPGHQIGCNSAKSGTEQQQAAARLAV